MSVRPRRLLVLAAVLALVPAAQAADPTITDVAGTVPGLAGDGGPATSARLDGPRALALAPDGSLLIADTANNRIRRVTPGGIISTLAGTTRGFSGDGDRADRAQLDTPTGVAVAADGSVLIADTGNDRIRRVSPQGIITTIAGGAPGLSGDGGPASAARLDSPGGVAIASDGGLLVADTGNDRIRRISPAGTITTIVGTQGGFAGDGGPAAAARLESPAAVTPAAGGSLLVADTGNRRIRFVAPDGVITTVAGGGTGFAAEAGGTTELSFPTDAVPLPDGGVLVADAGADRLRRVTPLGAVVTVAPGAGFAGPADLLPTTGGAFLVSESGAARIQRIDGLGDLPGPVPLQTVAVAPALGSVTVQPAGAAGPIALRGADLTTNLSQVDATAGRITLTVSSPAAPGEAFGEVGGARFVVNQPSAPRAVADLTLTDRLTCRRRTPRAGVKRETAGTSRRRVRVRARGWVRTRGEYATAVANGTAWTLVDRCDRTIIRVTEGSVTVRDLVRKRLVTVRAGKTYVALAKPPRRR